MDEKTKKNKDAITTLFKEKDITTDLLINKKFAEKKKSLQAMTIQNFSKSIKENID